MSKKEKDRVALEEYVNRFRELDTETLVQRLGIIWNNNFARQAINIVLKERGEKK